MTSSKNDIPKNQSVPKSIMGKADTYEDEIDLIDYLRVLWKRKYFIVLGSVLPALIVFLFIYFSPRDYTQTYLYDTGLTEKSYKTLLDKFHSTENVDKLTPKLKENELKENWQEMIESNVKLEVSPLYFGKNAAQTTDLDNLQKIQEAKGTLLAMTIIGRPRKDIEKISSIVRDNFEKILPMYSVHEGLNITIINFKTKMADIEKGRFLLELDLKKKKAILEKLKKLEPADSNNIPGGIILQFNNVGQSSEYLPLAYQIQANISNIIDCEETIRANLDEYDYYKNLISFNEKLLDEVKNKTSSYYTIQEFHSFLTNIMGDYTEKELTDYLNAYTKRIENMISINTPVIEKPSVYLIPKGAARKSAVSFVVLLMITTLIAFLLEAVRQKQAPAP